MDFSTQNIELFCNEVMFADLIIAEIMVNDPSYDKSRNSVKNTLNTRPLLSDLSVNSLPPALGSFSFLYI